ncbi:hypothetical protein B5X24_HaOG208071 [Helicoverpa armigera]|nr:hypothetical protein B5X24_HaOG208071 [Helicoverpa armigera]
MHRHHIRLCMQALSNMRLRNIYQYIAHDVCIAGVVRSRLAWAPLTAITDNVFLRLTAGDIFYSRRTVVIPSMQINCFTAGASHVPRLWRLHDELVFYARIKLC